MAKSKIIKDLANGLVDTITALKRAKVLVSDLNNAEISKWLDCEISGYPADVAVPSYRKVHGSNGFLFQEFNGKSYYMEECIHSFRKNA